MRSTTACFNTRKAVAIEDWRRVRNCEVQPNENSFIEPGRDGFVGQATKAVYSSLIAQSIRWEIGESFFNSLTRRVFATEGVDQAIEFVDTDFDAPPTEHDAELCRASTGAALPDLISSALTDVDSGFANHYLRDLDGAIAAAAKRILSRIVQQKDATLEVFRGVFYRCRRAYLLGR